MIQAHARTLFQVLDYHANDSHLCFVMFVCVVLTKIFKFHLRRNRFGIKRQTTYMKTNHSSLTQVYFNDFILRVTNNTFPCTFMCTRSISIITSPFVTF